MGDYKLVPVGRPQIREAFLRNGFTIAPDRDDLEDRVYEAAFELLELAKPAVQGDQQNSSAPPDIMAIRMLIAAGFVTEEKANEALCIAHGFAKGPIKPAEQPECGCCAQTTKCDDDCDAKQPAPDVAGLVEALEEIIHPVRFMQERLEEGERLNGMAAVQLAEDASYLRGIAIAALAAHRKQEPSHDNQ